MHYVWLFDVLMGKLTGNSKKVCQKGKLNMNDTIYEFFSLWWCLVFTLYVCVCVCV